MDMNSTLSLDTHQKMLKNVKGLMLGRMIILTLLLAITFLFQISEKKYFFVPMTNHFYYFIGLFYLVTIVYAIFFKKVRDLNRYASFQITIDHLFIAAANVTDAAGSAGDQDELGFCFHNRFAFNGLRVTLNRYPDRCAAWPHTGASAAAG